MSNYQTIKDKLKSEYSDIDDRLFDIVFDKAWDDGHAYGESEIRIHFDDLLEMANKILQKVAGW